MKCKFQRVRCEISRNYRHDRLTRSLRILAVLLPLCLSGCAIQHYADPKHIVMVNKDGELLQPSDKKPISKIDYDKYFDAIERNIEQSLATYTNGILIFIHGGLNTPNGTVERATNLTPKIEAEGYYPIFINWDSNLYGSYAEHLWLIRQGQIQRWWMRPITAPLYLIADIGRAVTRAPVVWYHQVATDMKTAKPFGDPYAADCTNGSSNPHPLWDFLNPEIASVKAIDCRLEYRYEQGDPRAVPISRGKYTETGFGRTLNICVFWVTYPAKFALAPFIDAMGRSAWENMSRRTKTLFRKPSEFDVYKWRTNATAIVRSLDAPPSGALSRFLDHLQAFEATNNRVIPVTLIGHSMGAMVSCEIIRRYDNLPYSNIVFMAGACTINDMEQSVINYMSTHPSANFYNLCLHPLAEAREMHESVLDLPPRGSLLAWIDNFLSTPETPMDRTLGQWDNIIQAAQVLQTNENVRARVHLKAFGGPLNTNDFPEGNPQKHGAFSTTDFWKSGFWRPKSLTNRTGPTSPE